MEQYIGFAVAVAVLYMAYKYYQTHKNKAGKGTGGTKESEGSTKEK